MKKPIIAGKISNDLACLQNKRQTGTNSCNFDTPDDSLPSFPILLASKRK